jgi:hypothetical protein
LWAGIGGPISRFDEDVCVDSPLPRQREAVLELGGSLVGRRPLSLTSSHASHPLHCMRPNKGIRLMNILSYK